MTDTASIDLSFDEFDEQVNPAPELTDFDQVVDRAISRRGFLGRGIAVGATAFVMGSTALTPIRAFAASRLAFDAVPANSDDTITVPNGYSWHIVVKWGDPLWSNAPDFDQATRGNGASQETSYGDNIVGMALFAIGNQNVLVNNNEYTNRKIIYGNRESGLPENADDVRKGKAAHGVSVTEIAEKDGKWGVVIDSPFNRRITADTPMDITGPARGHDMLKTAADPDGAQSLGTWNNCGNGRTPWGTYLACEENFNGYYSSSDENFQPTDHMKRYGVSNKDWGYAWATTDERFDISKHPNESNRNGYVVEIDPADPNSTPKKRTALGRFKHENAELVIANNGKVVVYMGDDERGEFLYRFVSDGVYTQGSDNSDLLENGRLYVAKFDDEMRGQWLELSPETSGMASHGDVCVMTRQAASKVGATTMDRPEWVSAHPSKAEVYCCLTNNKNRGKKPNTGGDDTSANGPNPRVGNNYGRSCVGGRMAVTIPRTASTGTCSCWPATRPSTTMHTAVRTTSRRTTCSIRRTGWASIPPACCGSRPTGTTATRTTSPAWATTRCWSPTRRRARSSASWSARTNAKSPASPGARTARPCSSASSTRAKRATATGPTAAIPCRGPQSLRSPATTAA